MSEAAAPELVNRVRGPVWVAGRGDHAGYDEERRGFNLALDQRPGIALGAATEADIVAGIRFASDHGLAVGLQATGHGAGSAMDGDLLINTRRLVEVAVDPASATARVAAGATSAAVMAAAARYGLAAPVGGAPSVGFVSYTLGGGLGPFGRAFGYAADRVRRLDVVTADGRQLTVTSEHHPDLFWALRGGGGNFAAVTAMEIDLVTITSLYGGGLFFAGEQAPEVTRVLNRCIASAPEELTLSIAFVTYPALTAVPPPLRGRFCCHVRVAHVGDLEHGERLIAPLRALAPLLDTVRTMPLTDIGTIHADPTRPMRVNSNSAALLTGSEEVMDILLPFLGPTAAFMLEVRPLGGALARRPDVDNAVGHRTARVNLFTSVYPDSDLAGAADAQQRVYDAVAAHSVGGALRNFQPAGRMDATTAYGPDIAARLAELKSVWDPRDVFRYAPSFADSSPQVGRSP